MYSDPFTYVYCGHTFLVRNSVRLTFYVMCSLLHKIVMQPQCEWSTWPHEPGFCDTVCAMITQLQASMLVCGMGCWLRGACLPIHVCKDWGPHQLKLALHIFVTSASSCLTSLMYVCNAHMPLWYGYHLVLCQCSKGADKKQLLNRFSQLQQTPVAIGVVGSNTAAFQCRVGYIQLISRCHGILWIYVYKIFLIRSRIYSVKTDAGCESI